MTNLNDGIHLIARSTYDKVDRTNWSRLKHMAKSPAHYRHNSLNGGPDSDARKRGRAVHLAVFEPELFARECVVWPEGSGRRYGAKWDKFCEEHAGLEILKEDEHELCLAIQASVRNHPVASTYLQGGMAEASLLWTHKVEPIGGLPGYSIECKGRVDFILKTPNAIVDLKTTRDASPEGFGREAWRLKYHTQAAFYVDGYAAITGDVLPFVMIAVEATEPHVVTVVDVPDIVLDVGREEYRALLERLVMCRTENRWPAYAEEQVELALPRWAVDFNDDDNLTDIGVDFGEAAS